ncbi:putative DEAD box helicase [Macrophomina phaseolina]|uniref:DEAD box helicase n=1 Tax=Macrophomina phaseolina TaxID=35725 RepID=A0ABQ8GRJ3_9PEZI|nr:putative DEAD box helicase [Macrophomina phaseolina]
MARKKPKMISYFQKPAPDTEAAQPASVQPQASECDAPWALMERSARRPPTTTTRLVDLAESDPTEGACDPGYGQDGDTDEVNPWVREKLHYASAQETPALKPSSLMPVPCAIREYVAQANLPVNADSWLARPEIPTADEMLDTTEPSNGVVSIAPNKTDGAWGCKEEYLETHYELLREDTIRPLREAVGRVKNKSWGAESEYGTTVGVYNNVRIAGFTFSTRGLAARIQFSLSRSGKKIHWEQSKRLITGTLLALTPEDDCFQTQCVMAVVAARPLANLIQDPPGIDILFARSDEVEFDPGKSWLMVEERTGYFEGTRHTLRALQKLMREPFPLSEYIINVKQEAEPPEYILENPRLDLSSIFTGDYHNVDVVNGWPDSPGTELDTTQLHALQRMLTKRCAIIQGPPGTGKTHVSVVALKALLSNMDYGSDSPIIVACQTNHALDQLLRHVAEFEPDFARLGGRSRDHDIIKKRTLFELKQAERPGAIAGGQMRLANRRLKHAECELRKTLWPLRLGAPFIPHTLMLKLGVLTKAQFDSLERGDTLWVDHRKQSQAAATTREDPIKEWIGKHYEPVEWGIPPDEFAFDYEEVDLEFEQLKEVEAENMVKDDEDFEILRGESINICDNLAGKQSTNLTDDDIHALLSRTGDMYKIKDRQRGAVYNYLQHHVKQVLLQKFRFHAKEYENATLQRTVGRWEQDHMVLRKQKIIGMTTTGLSKYRALISSLNPKIILIEEAAETLEAPVTASCVPSLEHLILVGDHQQLRPRCHVSEHENLPFNLNVSLFERLVKNEVEYETLRRQRRMIPEIRRLLKPIYRDIIKDHPSVKDLAVRPLVPGMGQVSSFFFTHEWPESVDAQMSSCNLKEADMIVQFYVYLFMNKVEYSEITVLTFYNGQRKLILKELRSHPELQGIGRDFRVVTVDSYQGEENDVVLLSLVRNNLEGRIGFLNNANRICVALSRAKRGFYMFGNGQLLASESKVWSEVITQLAGKLSKRNKEDMRVGYHLPLTCTNHGRRTFVGELDDWKPINGGCDMRCNGRLPCGHLCPYRCHPYEHEVVNCLQKCRKVLTCGHECAGICADECRCTICVRMADAVLRTGARPAAHAQAPHAAPAVSVFPNLPIARAGPVHSTTPASRPVLGPQPGLPRQPGSASAPAPPATHGRSDSTGSDLASWHSYSMNVKTHDAHLAHKANEDFAKKQKELEKRTIAALEAEMERSVLDESYRGAPLPPTGSFSSSTTAVVTETDGQVTPLRQKWVDSFDPYPGGKKLSEPSILDTD